MDAQLFRQMRLCRFDVGATACPSQESSLHHCQSSHWRTDADIHSDWSSQHWLVFKRLGSRRHRCTTSMYSTYLLVDTYMYRSRDGKGWLITIPCMWWKQKMVVEMYEAEHYRTCVHERKLFTSNLMSQHTVGENVRTKQSCQCSGSTWTAFALLSEVSFTYWHIDLFILNTINLLRLKKIISHLHL